MSGLFITGTDTEVGKTFVSTMLIKLLVDEGLNVSAMKPIASGAKEIDGMLQNEDALSLINASNVAAEYQTVNPYVFEPAISPHIAAEQAGIEVDCKKIKSSFDQLNKVSDVVVVEGVGGWYAPLSDHTTVADLAAELNLPIILVVGLRLGCLNHTLLTAQAIRQAGLPIAGWIANYVEKDFVSAKENIKTLQHFLHDFPLLGTVPFELNDEQDEQNQADLNNKKHRYNLNKEIIMNNVIIKK